jgi:DNA repair exonuclease SbcCD ATPase subunit
MSKIILLESQNVKRLRAVSLKPDGAMNCIGGANGAGKSSVLDSIAMALGGKDEIPAMPVRRGEAKATIVLTTDDGYTIKRTFTAAGGTALIIENTDKMRASSPQELLSRLTGKLMFDPLAFINLDAKAQAAALKKLVGLDSSALDAQRKKLYEERAVVNATAKQAEARASFMPSTDGLPAEESSVTDIVTERDQAKEHNAKAKALDTQVEQAEDVLSDAVRGRALIDKEIADLDTRLANLREQLKEYDAKTPAFGARHTSAVTARTSFVPVDVAPINIRLAGAESQNAQIRQNKAKAAALREAEAIAARSVALTTQIDEIDRQKGELLAAQKFPVAGLSVHDELGVTFDGVPFDQASTSQQMRVSVAMAAALNPKLRVMLVRDGSLLDDQSLQLLGELAVEHDLQCFVERVGKGAECSVIISDGEVESPTVTTG